MIDGSFSVTLIKVSFEFKEEETLVVVDYETQPHDSQVRAIYKRSKAFPAYRDAISIISREISNLEFLTWVGIREARV